MPSLDRQKDSDFDAAYRSAKRAAFAQSIARLHHLSSAAVSTLGKIMLDGELERVAEEAKKR